MGCSFAPQVNTAWCYLGGPWECSLRTQGVSSGQAAKARQWGVSTDLGGGTPAWPRSRGGPLQGLHQDSVVEVGERRGSL